MLYVPMWPMWLIVHAGSPSAKVYRRLVRASAAAALAALMLVALFLGFGNQDAWAQVAEAVRTKPWVRWTFQAPNDLPVPAGFRAPECWYSAKEKVFAGRANGSAHYVDLAGQETYDYTARSNSLVRSLTSDVDNFDVGHFETMIRLISEWDRAPKLPESPIQILGRTRLVVADGNRQWAEYTFACRDSRRTVKDYQVTFRVDPATRLPVEMRSTEKFAAADPAGERTYAIDYPKVGPGDVYALGVPRDAKVVDRRRARVKTPGEIKDFLAAYVKARARPLERFTTTVLRSDPHMNFTDIQSAFRAGPSEDTPFEEVDAEQLMEHRKKVRSGMFPRPKDASPAAWWGQQVKDLKFKPMPGGGVMLPHCIGYPPELLTIGLSPVDNPDCRVTLDRKPVKGPPGTALLRITTETTFGYNDCFFWIDPDRDYMVMRHEIHFSRDHAAWNNSTQIIDQVERSPGGRWYATAVRSGRIERHGEDLPAKQILATGERGTTLGPVTTSSYRYLVDFK
jgi:hypothetical protein